MRPALLIRILICAVCVALAISFYLPRKNKIVHQPEKVAIVDEVESTHQLVFEKVETLVSSAGTKSVLFNSKGTKLYAMNLEGMSIYEFDEATKSITKQFKFKPTKGTGWDYALQRSIPSFEEKPVEACFSHNDKILWVSLHNAGGIVSLTLDSLKLGTDSLHMKSVMVFDTLKGTRTNVRVPFIPTGKTPKVIARTADDKYLLVSNWHSKTVSVLEMNDKIVPYGKVVANIPVSAIPRGIVVDDKNKQSYIAIMGGSELCVVDNTTWKIIRTIHVASNPRHIVMDKAGRLFVSFNKLAQVACIDPVSGKTLFKIGTHAQPRTIILSKDQQYLFVTCYAGNKVDVFKVGDTSFVKNYSLDCPGKPVGIDLYEDKNKLEAWVCNYVGGSLKVFTFKRK